MRPSLLWLWAMRDLMRRPGEGLLAAAGLGSFVWIVGTALLLVSAVNRTTELVVEAGPSVVVRRLGPAGFEPVPTTATTALAKVPGALDVRPRLWGPARAGEDPVEVVAVDARIRAALQAAEYPVPDLETAVAGPGFADKRRAYVLLTGPADQTTLQIREVLPPVLGLVAQDTLLVTSSVARRVLGVPEGHATDLVLDVNQESEEDPIRHDLQASLPFPSVITTRHDAGGSYAVSLGRRGGLFMVLLVPAGFALLLLVIGVARDRAGRSREVGVLKAVGWTTRDVLALHGLRAVWISLPAVALGAAGAWVTVFGPWVRWPAELLFGWRGAAPQLYLDPEGAALALVQVAATVVLPWVVASLWPAVVASAKDPWDLIGEDAA